MAVRGQLHSSDEAVASIASRAAFRDDREAPLYRAGTARTKASDLPDGTSGIFFARGLDTISGNPHDGQIRSFRWADNRIDFHSGNPALRRPSSYLARSVGRRPGATAPRRIPLGAQLLQLRPLIDGGLFNPIDDGVSRARCIPARRWSSPILRQAPRRVQHQISPSSRKTRRRWENAEKANSNLWSGCPAVRANRDFRIRRECDPARRWEFEWTTREELKLL